MFETVERGRKGAKVGGFGIMLRCWEVEDQQIPLESGIKQLRNT